MTESRQPAGVPTGGQFATSAKAESGVALEHRDVALPTGTAWHTEEPLDTLRLAAENRMASEMVRMVKDGLMTLDALYQRGDVWSTDQRIGLLKSMIQRLPVPAIITNARHSSAWAEKTGHPAEGEPLVAIVDGKQRVETLRQWYDGELPVPASWFEPDEIAQTRTAADGAEWVTFDDLTRRGQSRTENRFAFPVAAASVGTIEEEAELYLLVNGSGTAQTDADMTNAAAIAGGTR